MNWDDTYLTRYPISATKVNDGSAISGEIVLVTRDTPEGTYFYALPITEDRQVAPSKDIHTTSIEVLTKKNQELLEENARLKAREDLLILQNQELLSRLMSYADKALEVLHAQKLGTERGSSSSAKSTNSRGRASKNSEEAT